MGLINQRAQSVTAGDYEFVRATDPGTRRKKARLNGVPSSQGRKTLGCLLSPNLCPSCPLCRCDSLAGGSRHSSLLACWFGSGVRSDKSRERPIQCRQLLLYFVSFLLQMPDYERQVSHWLVPPRLSIIAGQEREGRFLIPSLGRRTLNFAAGFPC